MHESPGYRPPHLLIIDNHEVSRAALRALLRTEGMEVLDMPAGEQVMADSVARASDVAIVDVSPGDTSALALARALRDLPDGPVVVLTSSHDRSEFGAELDGLGFIQKAQLCADQLVLHANKAN